MTSIKRLLNKPGFKWHLQSTCSAALFIILILQIQLAEPSELGENKVPSDNGQNNQATTDLTPTSKAQNEAVSSSGSNSKMTDTTLGQESPTTTTTAPPVVTTTMSSFTGSLGDDEPASDRDEGNVAVALEAATAKRTTVKKELTPTTEPTPREEPAVEPTATTVTESNSSPEQKQASPLGSLLPSANRQATELARMSPGLSSAIGDLAEQLPGIYNREQVPANESNESIERLLPTNTNLFNQDAIDATQLGEMDCHLRNLDYCIAGLLGTAQKILPETNTELDTRCDEMKATTSCLAIYNKRCATFKVLAVLAPYTQASSNPLMSSSNLLTDSQRELVSSAASGIMSQPVISSMGASKPSSRAPTMTSLMEVCEPHARKSPAGIELRQRLFQMAKCVNSRVPKLTPCIEDLKTAVQVFYEPKRVLPMRPTCCAIARFRACSTEALDGICGLSSFDQLIQSFSGQGSPVSMIKTIDRLCRQATDYRSSYCKEVLPPSGMKTPQRRGNKASKLAKALDLISFSPATQEMGAF